MKLISQEHRDFTLGSQDSNIDKTVRAILRYVTPTSAKPIYHASEGGSEAEIRVEHAEFVDCKVPIHNARTALEHASLDTQGFAITVHRTTVENFYDMGLALYGYEDEIGSLVLKATGAESVLIFDHTLHSDSPEIRGWHRTREVASVIHNDYTDYSAHKRLRELLPEQAGYRAEKRFAIVNLWRSIAGPVLRKPLACCDAQTLEPGDLITSERRAKGRTGELELVSFNNHHRWYYFPEMQSHEALLIKTFDSLSTGVARRSVHTAFDNPLAPADAAPRESMESRMFVFFED